MTAVTELVQRQKDPELRAARDGLAFDNSAVIADHLGNECKSKATSLRLGRDEGIEQVLDQIRRHTRPVVADSNLERQGDPLRRSRHLHADARPIGGRQRDLAVEGVFANGFRRILHEIQ